MDTISTIVGPSITLLWPLVGGSLASDWVKLLEFRYVGDGHRSWPCWGGGGDQWL